MTRRPLLWKQSKFRRKQTKMSTKLYFNSGFRKSQNLLKRLPYRASSSSLSSGLFFRMFPVSSLPTAPTVVNFGPANSSFWFYGIHSTQFSAPSWVLRDIFFNPNLFLFQIGKDSIRDIHSLRTNFSSHHALLFVNRSGGSVVINANAHGSQPYYKVPTIYALQLTSAFQTFNSSSAWLLRSFLILQSCNSPRRLLSSWIAHTTKTNWLRYKSALRRHNVILKKTARRIFSFYFYDVPTSFVRGRESKRFIPELPFALRGSVWSESPRVVKSAVSDLWQNETAHELARLAPNRISHVFRSPRISNLQSSYLASQSNFTSFSNVLLNKLTHRRFKNTFYPKSASPIQFAQLPLASRLSYSSRKLLALRARSLPKSRGPKRSVTIYKTRQRLESKKRRSPNLFNAITPVWRLHSLRSRAPILAEVTYSACENSRDSLESPVPKSLVPRIGFKLRRNARRRLRILKSRTRRKLRRKQWSRRLFVRVQSRLRRNPQRRLRASKARKFAWRRLQRLLNSSLNLSKRPVKAKIRNARNRKVVNHKVLYETHRLVQKQFKFEHSRSYRPVITSLILNGIVYQKHSVLTSSDSIRTTVHEVYAPRVRPDFNRSSLLASADSHLPTLLTVWNSPVLLKYSLLNPSFSEKNSRLLENNRLSNSIVGAFARRLQNQLSAYFFGSQSSNLRKLNIWNVQCANYVLRKRLLRVSSNSLFLPDVTMWYYRTLVRFIENCTGRRVALHFGPFAEGALTFEDRAQVSIWSGRVIGFQKMLGHKIFAQEALMLVTVAIRLKDPTFLANWIRGMLKRLSFWKYRLIFRYLKYIIRHLFKSKFDHFQFKGFKLRLKGKISVAGNARTRTLSLRVGDTSHSKTDNRVAYDLSYVGTFTGVLGFKLWFFY